MFCHHCGEKLPQESQFCTSCGTRMTKKSNLTSEQVKPVATDAAKYTKINTKETKQQPKNSASLWLAILPPFLSLILIGGGVAAYYFYEQNQNERVLSLQAAAEEAAITGDYSRAKNDLYKAQEIRPDYAVLTHDLQEIKRMETYKKDLDAIGEQIKGQKYTEAEESLNTLKQQAQGETGPLFSPLNQLIDDKEVIITVGKVKQELDQLTTVSALADKLNVISSLPAEEAEGVKKQILNKIVQISSDNATIKLESKQFSDALATINEGLEHATDDKTLLSFKDKIEQEQLAFENAEQERLEQAMEAAAKEELKNQTAAVEVTAFETYIDEYGDLYLYGDITNVATTEISSVTIYYTVYDTDGYYLDDSYTTVYPYYLSPGEMGSFEDYMYYVYEDVTVEIDDITWYVE